ncbi:MAG: PIN domain-containing protein [Chromatiaceae bacterium]|nr:PIN domain-containing protein [Chromatiaceae bacterium]
MKERSFLDTNVLVYTDDADAPAKQATSLSLLRAGWATGNGVLSTQVLQEYFAAVTRKLGVDAAVARRKVELFGRLEMLSIGHDDILRAIDLHRLHGFSIWDALIVTMALKAQWRVLYSEDMQDGRVIDGLRIANPFKPESR